MSWQGFAWRSAFSNIDKENTQQEKYQIFGLLEDTNENVSKNNKESLMKFIEKDIIGKEASFEGPYGRRKILYTDYIASGKAMNCIEQFIMKCVLPTYANTHTKSNVTGSQTSSYRNESKEIIRSALNANDNDVVIFTGSGVTGAIHKLISVLRLKQPPVIFCGPFEHHSNLLPWREMDGQVINISENADGMVNLHHLEMALKKWAKSGRPMIGSFSAASNVTGITTDTKKVAAMLHKYGAISLWDYATAAPYMDINMHPEPYEGYDTSKDAVFISMHKFVGSPDAPGLLVASKRLFQNEVPSGVGGGTVLFVSENNHKYLKHIEDREEGGTPAIIGSIRAGIAFKMKMAVGPDAIMARELELYNRALKVWKDIPELEILGLLEKQKKRTFTDHRVAVFSFLIRHAQSGYYLHYNFVTTLLNDLFGIQTRGGCACAGVYAQHLLGIDHDAEKRFGDVLQEDPERAKTRSRHESERTEYEILRPGFTRLNFPYFMSDEDADFLISAVGMVAKNGWTVLPQYRYNPRNGQWSHVEFEQILEETRLEDLSFHHDGLHLKLEAKYDNLPSSKIDCLKKAERIFFNATTIVGKHLGNQEKEFSQSKVKDLRWFLLPCEAQSALRGKKMEKQGKLIFEVRKQIKQISDEELQRSISSSDSESNNEPVETTQKRDLIKEQSVTDLLNKKNKKKSIGIKSLLCRTKNSVEVISRKT